MYGYSTHRGNRKVGRIQIDLPRPVAVLQLSHNVAHKRSGEQPEEEANAGQQRELHTRKLEQ